MVKLIPNAYSTVTPYLILNIEFYKNAFGDSRKEYAR
jgi:hypothetical protein